MAMLVEETDYGTKLLRCDCNETAIRFRVRNNGVSVYVMQCLTCGRELHQISKTAPEVLSLTERVPFDDNLVVAWQRKQRTFYQLQSDQRQRQAEQEREAQNAEWWKNYNRYLRTPQWEEKRRRVMARAGNMCEGCGKKRAVQVHHLTYEHVFNEFLFELVAVCMDCHRRIHQDAA